MTKAQVTSLEVLSRKAIRVITGLPEHTRIEGLQALAKTNTLKQLAEERKASQLVLPQDSKAGRVILRSPQQDTGTLKPLAIPLPQWEYTQVVLKKQLLLKMSTGDPGRRQTQAQQHQEGIAHRHEQRTTAQQPSRAGVVRRQSDKDGHVESQAYYTTLRGRVGSQLCCR